jgi:tripartite-type tricarboxylate transporter receptor subunit TctC
MHSLIRSAAVLAATLASLGVPPAFAQDYPNKPIRLIVPFPPAGTVDPVTRILAEVMSKSLGQQIVIENKPGANGNVGTTEAVVASSGSLATNPALYKTMPFDVKRDLMPVALYANVPNILVLHPSLPVNTLGEFTSYVRTNSGKLNFGSSGNGSSMHLAGELYRKMTDTQMTHVPYAQVGQATTDLIGGQLQLMFQLVPGVAQHVRKGSVRAVAVLAPRRIAALPDVPTSAEAGMPGLESSAWFGILAPVGTPRPIIDRMNREINAALKDPSLLKRYTDFGADVLGGTPEEFARFHDAELKKWADVVKFSGAKID